MDDIYDIGIIGAGIAGSGIARDGAMRDLSCIVFEKSTVGAGASSKSSRLIHGGIRYLETSWIHLKQKQFKEALKNFKFVYYSLKECRTLQKIAPDIIKPIPMVIPIYKKDPRNLWIVFLGAWLYFFLSLLSGKTYAPKVFLNKKSLLKELPKLREEGLLGGVMIWDRLTSDIGLVQKTMQSATKHGCQLEENTKIENYQFDNEKKCFKVLAKLKSGQIKEYYVKQLINASGPWVDTIHNQSDLKSKKRKFIVPIAGSHIHLKKFLKTSVLLQAEDRRIFFCINLDDQTARIGTTEWLCQNLDQVSTPAKDIQYLIDSLRFYFPTLNFKFEDVLHSDSGVRPLLRSGKTKTASTISRDHEIIWSPSGLLNVIGVKLTDYRRASEEVIDEVIKKMGSTSNHQKCKTHSELL